ncbi:hypothetical protein L7F22_058366 [Adiantum nelumboides]|nr:hypothetical protein [Adiantum nelumboides]
MERGLLGAGPAVDNNKRKRDAKAQYIASMMQGNPKMLLAASPVFRGIPQQQLPFSVATSPSLADPVYQARIKLPLPWVNILSQFHFQIVHVQGQKNVVADALSRKRLVQAISAIHHSTFEDMIDQYATDPDFADIFTWIRDGETVAGYSLREGYLMRKTMLCVTQPFREKVMTKCQCPPYTGHCGIATTMKGVERYFYWPRLKKDVEEFVRSCLVCQKVKFDTHKAQGLLQPLPIPTRPGESIAMDFIFDLPRTQSGHDGIWTIIDRFNKLAHFVPVKKTVKPDHLARLFVTQIFRLHGMPETIVSDRDPRCTSLFWKAIWENIGTRLQFSSSFHPQTDGQSEIANSVVLDLLKSYISDQKTP